MELVIRNMVCDRCLRAVRTLFEQQGLHPVLITLGKVVLQKDWSPAQKKAMLNGLEKEGFELIEDERLKLVEEIRQAILRLVYLEDPRERRETLSVWLSGIVERDYAVLSELFSAIEGISIEQYFLLQRIERVKELLLYDELSLSQIADKTGFSSVAHLSAQFKKITGITASAFRTIKYPQRRPLDKLQPE